MNEFPGKYNWFTEPRFFDLGPLHFFLDGLDCWCVGWFTTGHITMLWLWWHWKPWKIRAGKKRLGHAAKWDVG